MSDFAAKFSKPKADEDAVEVADIAADDAFVESLLSATLFDDVPPAADPPGRPGPQIPMQRSGMAIPEQRSSAEVEVAALLRAWRTEVNAAPLPEPIPVDVALTVLRQTPPRRRALRPILAVAAAITGLLVGSAAIGARSATPDSPLWPVTQLLWGDRVDSVLAGQTAKEGLEVAHQALDAGHPEAAETALDQVTSAITMVDERDGRTSLESDYQSVKSRLDTVTKSRGTASSTSTTASTGPSTPASSTGPVPPPLVVPGTSSPDAGTSADSPPSASTSSTGSTASTATTATTEPSDATEPQPPIEPSTTTSTATSSTDSDTSSSEDTTSSSAADPSSETAPTTKSSASGALGADGETAPPIDGPAADPPAEPQGVEPAPAPKILASPAGVSADQAADGAGAAAVVQAADPVADQAADSVPDESAAGTR